MGLKVSSAFSCMLCGDRIHMCSLSTVCQELQQAVIESKTTVPAQADSDSRVPAASGAVPEALQAGEVSVVGGLRADPLRNTRCARHQSALDSNSTGKQLADASDNYRPEPPPSTVSDKLSLCTSGNPSTRCTCFAQVLDMVYDSASLIWSQTCAPFPVTSAHLSDSCSSCHQFFRGSDRITC